jgi:signal transduction histidine kinase/CheY-like chemotaxis protein
MYGWTREEVIGCACDRPQFSQAYAVPGRALVERALAGQPCSAVLDALRKDGSTIVTEVQAVPFTQRGEPHVLAIARDITERRAAEAERTALEAQLRQAQKMEAIGQLTGGIAHDFNNILTSVIGYLVLAQERAERIGDAALLRQLGSGQAAAQRARELIAQMLAFARRQRGDRRVIALAPAVRQGLQLLRSTLPSSIVLDDSALADADALPPVRADAVQIEQVLFNLCLNARDAMPRGGCITVRLIEQSDTAPRCTSCGSDVGAGRWLRLSVSDTGTGIDPAVVSRMFEPFFTTKEVGRGSGMGLAMVHGIVHEHDGHVVVDSTPGVGSHFHVLLPVADGEVDPASAATPVATSGRRFRGRVMVVEDEPMVAGFMRELLEGWGLEVVVPADALSALRWFDDPAQQVDLLITDLTMPQLGGLDLAHHVGVLRPQLPVLLYSGDADAMDADALRRAGIAAVLGKPVDPQQLAALLGRWVQAR